MAAINLPTKPPTPVIGKPEQPTSSYATLCLPGNTLEQQLLAVKNTEVRIAVAFASKTEQLVKSILGNQNRLTMIVGTINHFTDPVFIKECAELAACIPQRFQFYVDFRGDDSIHWKLYLITPNQTIIGSPNLTRTGISMQRDIAACVTDAGLWEASLAQFRNLQQRDTTMHSANPRFSKMLDAYRLGHRELSAQYDARVKTHRPLTETQANDFVTWVDQEHAQVLPIYIWDGDVTEEQLKTFKSKVQPKIAASEQSILGTIEVLGAYKGLKKVRHYNDGDIVLMMGQYGAEIGFEKFDVVMYGEGHWWVCQFSSTTTIAPFTMTPEQRRAFKAQAPLWYSQEKAFLDSRDLNSIAKRFRSSTTVSTK